MTIHYRYGGSTASRTLACPVWHELADEMPRPPESPAAALGTALHTIIELCLLDIDRDPCEFIDQTVEGVEITGEHIDEKIYPALDAFEQLMDDYDVDQYWCEVTAKVAEDIGGTADFVGLSTDGKTLVMADYKSGDGVMVDAEENKQALFYTMCLMDDTEERFTEAFKHVDTLAVAIVQPSMRRADILDVWETTPTTVELFKKDYEAAVAVSRCGNIDPCAGSHCKFCPAEVTCPAKTGLLANVERLPLDSLVPAHVSEALQVADEVESWLKAVRKFAHEQIERGVEIEGFKLVAKRATRVWNDKPAVEKKIKLMKKIKTAEAFDSKLKSPAQLEKVCKTHGVDYHDFEPFVSAVSSGTTLVIASDKRPSVIATEAARQVAARFA